MQEHETPEMETWISAVEVDGLHNRLSFRVDLKPGMNIIYGKNGIGKTTLLHVIANITEIDIERFSHLSFRWIEVTGSNNDVIRLEKSDGNLSVYINRQKTSYEAGGVGLSDLERQNIRSIVGERATYLPAFRSVLERMRENSYSPFEDRTRPEYDSLRQLEAEAFRQARSDDRMLRRDGSTIDANVSKTIRCRQWFGQFVPAVRYPSITDVVSGLNDEWTTAQIAISKIEQKQFETAFVEIFSAIAKGDVQKAETDQNVLLEEIRDLVSPEDGEAFGPHRNSTYSQLVNVTQESDGGNKIYSNILEIYRDKLLARKLERETILRPISAFQESVNVFLAEKLLKIGSRGRAGLARSRETNVFIEPNVGKAYGVTALSSGERQILTMLYSTSRSQFKSGCCLIDEPELSLHVDWQRIILKHMAKQHQGRQIIACTHSPEVGADHDDRVQFFSPHATDTADCETEVDDGASL